MTKTDTPKDHLYDKSYKRLFSHPQLVEELLRDFVKPDWLNQLDFTTLETVKASYVTEDYRDRSDDLVWKVQWRQETVLYIYILLEFQATVDPFMAVRVMVYLGLLYQDLIKTKQLTTDRQLPPVLPIVLYHGQDDSWNAKLDIQDLIAPWPASLAKYRPQLRYLLIDESCYGDDQLAPLLPKNAVASMFQLEHSRAPQDFIAVVQALSEWLTAPEQRALNEELTRWVRMILLAKRLPGIELEEITCLQELNTMLAKRIDEWTTQWQTEGWSKGRAEGQAEGLAKGRAQVLLRLLEEKFGPLATDIQNAVSQLEEHTVLESVKRIFTANSVQEVLGPKPR
jgi:predicted transposase YdaD